MVRGHRLLGQPLICFKKITFLEAQKADYTIFAMHAHYKTMSILSLVHLWSVLEMTLILVCFTLFQLRD